MSETTTTASVAAGTDNSQPAGTPPTPAQAAPQFQQSQLAPTPQQPEARREFYTPDEMSAVRSEAAEHRVRARDAAQAVEAAQATIAERDGQIAELQQQLAQAQEASTKLAQIEADQALTALVDQAHGAPIARAAIRGDNVIDGMDLTSEEGKKTALEAIKAYLGNHPELTQSVQAAPRSGTQIVGGSGEGAITQAQFDAMSAAERNQLFATNPALYRQLAGRG